MKLTLNNKQGKKKKFLEHLQNEYFVVAFLSFPLYIIITLCITSINICSLFKKKQSNIGVVEKSRLTKKNKGKQSFSFFSVLFFLFFSQSKWDFSIDLYYPPPQFHLFLTKWSIDCPCLSTIRAISGFELTIYYERRKKKILMSKTTTIWISLVPNDSNFNLSNCIKFSILHSITGIEREKKNGNGNGNARGEFQD